MFFKTQSLVLSYSQIFGGSHRMRLKNFSCSIQSSIGVWGVKVKEGISGLFFECPKPILMIVEGQGIQVLV